MFLFLLAAALGTTPATPVGTNLDAIRSAPASFDGKWVKLRGQMDSCWSAFCAICAVEATPDNPQWNRCLPLEWDRQVGQREEKGARFDAIYRYATVDIVARFDKACLIGICTDNGTLLHDARALVVLKRRPSEDGIRGGDRSENRLAAVSASAAAPLIALVRGKDDERRYRVFASGDDPNLDKSAVICVSRGEEGQPGTWPVDRLSVSAPSTEDNFKCILAGRWDGQWRLRPF